MNQQQPQQFNVDYFIKKFKAIPEDQWCVDKFSNDEGQKCAQGHCIPKSVLEGTPKEYNLRTSPEIQELKALILLFEKEVSRNTIIAHINNGTHSGYQQDSPKKRVLEALWQLKIKNRSKEKDKEKESVIVPQTIEEQISEMINSTKDKQLVTIND